MLLIIGINDLCNVQYSDLASPAGSGALADR